MKSPEEVLQALEIAEEAEQVCKEAGNLDGVQYWGGFADGLRFAAEANA